MATKNCKEYFVPQIVAVVTELKKKAAEVENNTLLEQQTKFMEGMANMICSYVFSECAKDASFDEALAYEYKNAERCMKFVVKKAEELNNTKSACLWIPDSVVYGWIKEYYLRDDKEEYEEEKRAEEEARIKAEEAEKKRAEKNAKKAEADIKKKIKEVVTLETVTSFFSNVNPTSEILSLIGADKYIGENIIREDNSEVRSDVIGLAIKAIADKKLTLTSLCGKYKLSKERLAQIEEEFRAKYTSTEEPNEEPEDIEEVDTDEDYDELGFVS